MKALVYTATREVSYRDEPEPVADTGDALIGIDAVGICGSDMHAYHGHDPRRVPPLILGHEAAGRVLEGPLTDRRVVLNPLISCGVCGYCTSGRQNLCAERRLIGMNHPGAFAERIRIPARNLIPIPDGMDPVHAALTEPTATALHGIHLTERAGHGVAEGRVLVIGGGSVGLLAALIAHWRGCRDITLAETNALRRRTAERTGICAVHDPLNEAPLEESGFELVFDAVGSPATRRAAIRAVRPGGVIVHVGLQENGGDFDMRKLTLAEITLIGVYTYTPNTLRASLAALHRGALGDLAWVETRPLTDGVAAFSDLDQGRTPAAKIVLTP